MAVFETCFPLGSAGFAHHQLEGYQQIHAWAVGMLHAIQHQLHRRLAYLRAILVNGG
jgi:hypothetical protein